MIQFTVPAIPVAQPRARVGKSKKTGNVVVYQAKASHPIHTFKAMCAFAAKQQIERIAFPAGEAVSIELTFVMPRPKSTPKRMTGRHWHTKKPDTDNLAKAVLDALSGIVWHDDAQIAEKRVRKVVSSEAETPHVVVRCSKCSEILEV